MTPRKRLTIAGICAGTALLIGGISDLRFAHTEEFGNAVVSCSTKRLLVQRVSLRDEPIAGPGVYGIDRMADLLLDHGLQQYASDTSGNPFQGLGIVLFEGLREPLKGFVSRALEDHCAGRETPGLASFIGNTTR